jgi:hypothetical protein
MVAARVAPLHRHPRPSRRAERAPRFHRAAVAVRRTCKASSTDEGRHRHPGWRTSHNPPFSAGSKMRASSQEPERALRARGGFAPGPQDALRVLHARARALLTGARGGAPSRRAKRGCADVAATITRLTPRPTPALSRVSSRAGGKVGVLGSSPTPVMMPPLVSRANPARPPYHDGRAVQARRASA